MSDPVHTRFRGFARGDFAGRVAPEDRGGGQPLRDRFGGYAAAVFAIGLLCSGAWAFSLVAAHIHADDEPGPDSTGDGAFSPGSLPVLSPPDGKPLQALLDAVAPGETVILSPGKYRGPAVIDKPLVLAGRGMPVIDGGGSGHAVEVRADGVTLRGLRIRRSGRNLSRDHAAVHVSGDDFAIEDCVIEECLHGVYLRKVSRARVLGNRIRGRTILPAESGPVERGLGVTPADCALVPARRGNGIHQWSCSDVEIRDNDIADVRDGILYSFTSGGVCEGNLVSRARYGLHYMYSDDNTVSGNVFTDNAAGAALMYSRRIEVRGNRFEGSRGHRAYGAILQTLEDARIEDNTLSRNAVGLAVNNCYRNRFVANRVVHNYVGLRFGSNSDDNGFSGNVFRRNLHPVEIAGDNGSNRWALAGVGNHWDGAAIHDFDGDGISSLPHRELDLFGALRREFPEVSLLSGSPAMKLLRFAGGRAAVPGLRAVEDPAPVAWGFVDRMPGGEAGETP